MIELNKLLDMIQNLREYMNKLIEEKGDLLDAEIITVSRMIDTLLNEYGKIIREKKNTKTE